jgi:hypothetical protein
MLDFNGLRWPHVSVATLRKQADAGGAGGGGAAAREVDAPAVAGAKAGVETELT